MPVLGLTTPTLVSIGSKRKSIDLVVLIDYVTLIFYSLNEYNSSVIDNQDAFGRPIGELLRIIEIVDSTDLNDDRALAQRARPLLMEFVWLYGCSLEIIEILGTPTI